MNYIDLLKTSAKKTNNCACMGLDPIFEAVPNKTGMVKDNLVSCPHADSGSRLPRRRCKNGNGSS
nr:hypothetical protein [Treponema denticola]